MGKTSDQASQDILQGKMWRLFWTLSLPAVIGFSINGLNAFVDAFFVGQYLGQDALAAISLAFPLTFITNGFSAMVGVGASSLLSIAIGSEDEDIQKKIFGTLGALSLIVSVILTIVLVYYAPEMIGFIGGKGEIKEMAVSYYRITMYGAFVRIFGVAANQLIRAEGKIQMAMNMSIAAAVANMILNPIFIVYLEMGVDGAAWATVLAMLLLSVIDVWYYYSGRASFPVDLKTFSLESKLLKPILLVGVSAMMLQIMFAVQQIMVNKLLSIHGTDRDFAFMGVCYRLLMLGLLPSFGIAVAMQPVVGINFGAKQYKRVKEAFKIFNLGATVIIFAMWAFFMLFPETCLGWMLPDATFSEQDIFNYRMMIVNLPFYPIFFIGTTLFQSIGNARDAGILMIAREIAIYFPILFSFAWYFGVDGIYYSRVPVNVIIFFIVVWMIRREFRKWKREPATLKEGTSIGE